MTIQREKGGRPRGGSPDRLTEGTPDQAGASIGTLDWRTVSGMDMDGHGWTGKLTGLA